MESKYNERVELSCHSRYSQMDGVSPVYALVDFARSNNMRAIALTDWMTVAGWEWLRDCTESAGEIKPIYGAEALVVDDSEFVDLKETDPEEYAKKVRARETFVVSVLVKKEEGRQVLFSLITRAENRYLADDGTCRFPWSEVQANREFLLIGSGGKEGDLHRKILEGMDEEELIKTASRYDYIEVTPVSEKRHIIDSKTGAVEDDEGMIELDRRLITLADKCSVPAVAVSCAYYIDEDDSELRAILRNAADAPDDNESDLHFRTTDEMLKEFSYLGEELARKIVIDNTNEIADQIEVFALHQEERLWPANEKADLLLLTICERSLSELYGDNIDDAVWERLTWEQECLMESGEAAVMLLVSQLVRESGLTAYEIGYRGFLGNSLVAFLCGITCVNPLETDPPLEPEPAYGVDGDRVLEIELNVPERECESIRALCDKMEGVAGACSYGQPQRLTPLGADRAISEYERRYGIRFENERRQVIELALCQNIKKTKNIHKGAVMLVPENCDITDYTPIITADDGKTKITGLPRMALDFMYRLDIYPSESVGMVSDLIKRTGVSVGSIALDDPKVMELFQNNGAIGVPEFNTRRSWEILDTLQPTCFSDLVKVSGLDHATGAWEQNAQFMLKEGIVEKEQVIGALDDIYDYIISLRKDREFAYQIVESVRRGSVYSGGDKRWEKNKALLREAGAEEWFIWSLERIKYLFPRGYIYRYVLDAWWCAWFKLNHPQEFYEVYFAHCGKPKLVAAVEKGADALCFYADGYDDAVGAQEQESGVHSHVDSLEIEVAWEMFARGYSLPHVRGLK